MSSNRSRYIVSARLCFWLLRSWPCQFEVFYWSYWYLTLVEMAWLSRESSSSHSISQNAVMLLSFTRGRRSDILFLSLRSFFFFNSLNVLCIIGPNPLSQCFVFRPVQEIWKWWTWRKRSCFREFVLSLTFHIFPPLFFIYSIASLIWVFFSYCWSKL